MKLINFSIHNFRSITKAHRIDLDNISTLVGKNNEGKSNILKALNISINALKNQGKRSRMMNSRKNDESLFCWERDYPVQLKNKKTSKETVFSLEFEFTTEESMEFKSVTGSSVNGVLHIQIRIGEDDLTHIEFKKSGKGTKTTWEKKAPKIIEYISGKINFTYIPAIRTEEHALGIVDDMIESALAEVETDPKYISAVKTINDLQTPILKTISKNIENSLKRFIPEIKTVKANTVEYRRRMALRRDTEIIIDDGNETNLEYKGDGIKSLVALSLLKDGSSEKKYSLIAIEEPESHLHSGAIHSLRESLYDLGKSTQVIITTHNPLFVNSDNISSNIIVSGGNAKQAKNIGEIRDTLGVRVSDNLSSASYILIVEGIEDEVAFYSLLNFHSPKIKKAIGNKALIISNLKGASKLTYKLGNLKAQICKYHVFLDNDTAGKEAYETANAAGLLSISNTTFAIAKGKTESEFEDLLDFNFYKQLIIDNYGVNIDCTDFKSGTKKWTERIKSVFMANGKIVDQKLIDQIKSDIASSISGNESIALSSHNKNIFDSLVTSLESLIQE